MENELCVILREDWYIMDNFIKKDFYMVFAYIILLVDTDDEFVVVLLAVGWKPWVIKA